jgi:hypothetical protein
MADIFFEQALVLNSTATHAGEGTAITSDQQYFLSQYLWLISQVELTSHVNWYAGYYSNVSYSLVDLPGYGKKLYTNAAGDSTITVKITYYGVRLDDKTRWGFHTPLLRRRIT